MDVISPQAGQLERNPAELLSLLSDYVEWGKGLAPVYIFGFIFIAWCVINGRLFFFSYFFFSF